MKIDLIDKILELNPNLLRDELERLGCEHLKEVLEYWTNVSKMKGTYH